MATVNPRQHIEDPTGETEGYIWENSTGNTGTDTFGAVKITKDDITVGATGTFDSANVEMHGSNTGESGTYVAVKDVNTGLAITLSADGAALGSESFVWYKPVVSDGLESTQDITITLLAK